jgi:hypothetical protein
MKHIFRTSGIPLVLIPSLIVSPVWAQSVSFVSDPSAQASNLQIRIVEEPKAPGAPFFPPQRITVQVQDENGRPVSDAAVAFRLPDSAMSGMFADGAHSAVAYTDASGVAHVDGIHWIASSGSVPVRITATRGNSHAGLLFEEKISQTAPATAAAATPIEKTSPAQPKTAEMPMPVPAPVASADQPKVTEPQVPLAPPTPEISAARPSVSISNYSKSSSAASNSLRPNADPSVSISSSPEGYSNHSGLKKWLIWTAIAAGGAGAAFALSGRSGNNSSATSSSTSTVGTPTINIGH